MSSASSPATRTLRVRLKDKHAAFLREQTFPSAYDLQPYTKGAGKELGLHSQTVQAAQKENCTRRRQFKMRRLA